METHEIISPSMLAEIKKGIDLRMDGTYNDAEFYSHMIAIVRDEIAKHLVHKEQMERLIFKTDELLENLRYLWGGDKQRYPACRKGADDLAKKLMNLQLMGYDISRFKKARPVQGGMFKK